MDNKEIKKARILVFVLIAVNVLIFAANLYISNHCWTLVDLPTFMTLLKDGNLDTLWMPKGFLTLDELIWDGPMIDLGQVAFGLDTESIFEGHHLHTMFTYAFLHADIMHLLSNMVSLYYISSMVLSNFGKKEFAIWYVSGIFGSAFATLIRAALTGKAICVVGASGAIFGLMGGLLSPMLYMLIRVKSSGGSISKEGKMAVFESIFFTLMMVIPGFFEENVSWEGHIGGLIGGLVAGFILFAVRERKFRVFARKSI